MDDAAFHDLVLAMPEATQSSHLGAIDFRVRGKIFAQPATATTGRALVKLTREQQEVMCAAEPDLFAPEPGYWGQMGWTRLAVAALDAATARAVLWTAWKNVAPKTLARAHAATMLATDL